MDFPGLPVMPAAVHTLSLGSPLIAQHQLGFTTQLASQAWAFGASVAVAVPLCLDGEFIATQAFWGNGTAVAGNVDLGLFTADGVERLYHTGSTAQAGTTALQVTTLGSPLLIPPGRYLLALSTDSASSTFLSAYNGVGAACRLSGLYASAASSPLPASLTLASIGTAATLTGVPLCGFSSPSIL